jgi:methanogenic corrinoid protein MtbC1/DNA-binding transcriptional ArsR family regulator
MRHSQDPDVLSLALAEPSRRALLENLRFGQKSVSELVQATFLKQPNVSNHLAKMREQGIVRAERIGRQVYYSLATPFADVLLRMHEVAANSQPHAISGSRNRSASVTNGIAEAPPSHAPYSEGAEVSETTLETWRHAYFESIMEGREDQATALVNAMLSRRIDMQRIYIEVFAESINRVGKHYEQGITDEAHEHMASAITERQMARVAQFFTPVTRLGHRAVFGCIAGNWHVLGLRMLADGLRSAGWDTFFLGANVPTPSFVTMVEAMQPELVVISMATDDQVEALHELLRQLRRLRAKDGGPQFGIAVGGHFIKERPEIAALAPPDFSAPDLPGFLEIVHSRFPSGHIS